jgi:hypothetical protein
MGRRLFLGLIAAVFLIGTLGCGKDEPVTIPEKGGARLPKVPKGAQ